MFLHGTEASYVQDDVVWLRFNGGMVGEVDLSAELEGRSSVPCVTGAIQGIPRGSPHPVVERRRGSGPRIPPRTGACRHLTTPPRNPAPGALFVFNAKTQRRKDAEGACLCERRGNLPASLHSRAASCSGMTPNPPETTPPFAIFAASGEKHPRTSSFPIYPTG
jgi:hypothetical protein